jgi:hypothetical protein
MYSPPSFMVAQILVPLCSLIVLVPSSSLKDYPVVLAVLSCLNFLAEHNIDGTRHS